MSHKLLLADDSVTIQRVIELTFAGEDVEVLTAGDGEEAIARLEADRPDIVLADVGMPKRSGYDLAAFIKERAEYAHIPVLLLAGAFEPVDEARARAVRCDGVLVKPFEPQHVVARVRDLLREAGRRAAGAASPDAPRPAQTPTPARPEGPGPVAPPPASGDTSLDEYFDRLDAAFAGMAAAPAEPPPAPVHHPEVMPRSEGPVGERDLDQFDLPSQTPDLAALPRAADIAPGRPDEAAPPRATFANPSAPFEWPPPAAAAARPADYAPAPPPGAPAGATLAGAFSALLAAEQGEAGAAPVRLALPPAPPAITDELVEEITRRVVERLGPAAVRDVVAEVVKEASERLIREEIARLRAKPK